MRIYIPTYGRSEKQVTLRNLPKKLQENCSLVVQDREAKLYSHYNNVDIKVLPKNIKTIGSTRDWIIENSIHPKLVMLDDDISFDTRRKDDPTKFYTSTEKEVYQLFKTIEKTLDKYFHVGVLAREGGNRITEPVIYNTRMMRVLAYNVKQIMLPAKSFSRMPVMEDFDVTLQLLRSNYPNAILCDWVQSQGTSNAEGGCSTYRTMELQERAALQLHKLHPEFVTVIKKKTKGAWGGQERTDVRIQWKKAYESSQR